MISVYQFKSKFQDFLRPYADQLVEKEVTANQVTLAAAGMSMFYAALLCFNASFFWVLLPVILFIRMAMNAIDGMIAREHNMKSKKGMALNELCDIVSDVALLIPFALFSPYAAWIVGFFMLFATLSEFCGILAYMMSGERRYDGPMGKSDRALAMGVIGFFIGVGVIGQGWIFWLFLVLCVMAMWTCYNRIDTALSINEAENFAKEQDASDEEDTPEDVKIVQDGE